VILPRAVEAAIIAHARQESPAECCGLLLGQAGRIADAVAVANVADDPSRHYAIDPREHFQVLREARARKLDVIGAYHSHPRSAAVPSATDRAEAFSGFVFLIVGLGTTPPVLSAWTWTDGNFADVPLVRLQ
jgi:proteasome lid subunit RPN8/RPN11